MTRLVLLLLLSMPLWGQPRRPEAFVLFGYGAVQGDEGSLGKGPVYSGAVTLPFAARWAFDLDLMHTRANRDVTGDVSFGANRTLLSPAIMYRRGVERYYWFAAGGIGGRWDRSFSRGPEGRFEGTDSGWTVPLRTGMVAALSERVVIRVALHAVVSFVVPDAGVQVGVGYRF